MDFRSLQVFRHLAASLHFGETASDMYLSPSTLSRIIQRLEQDCGCALFLRNNRSVMLTHAGERFAKFADKVLAQWDDVKDELQKENVELQGELSLYCSVTASQSHLPALIRQLTLRHPKVTLKLQTGDPALSIKHVHEKHNDVSLAIHPQSLASDVHFLPIDEVPLVLIAPKSWRVNTLSQIDWQQHHVVLPETGRSRDLVYRWFSEHEIEPQIYATVGGNEAIVAMVALGFGVGFVPQIVLDHSTATSNVARIQVEDITPYNLGVCCLASRKSQPLIKALLNVAAELSY